MSLKQKPQNNGFCAYNHLEPKVGSVRNPIVYVEIS